jgi:hypothetical protein
VSSLSSCRRATPAENAAATAAVATTATLASNIPQMARRTVHATCIGFATKA